MISKNTELKRQQFEINNLEKYKCITLHNAVNLINELKLVKTSSDNLSKYCNIFYHMLKNASATNKDNYTLNVYFLNNYSDIVQKILTFYLLENSVDINLFLLIATNCFALFKACMELNVFKCLSYEKNIDDKLKKLICIVIDLSHSVLDDKSINFDLQSLLNEIDDPLKDSVFVVLENISKYTINDFSKEREQLTKKYNKACDALQELYDEIDETNSIFCKDKKIFLKYFKAFYSDDDDIKLNL